MKKENSFVGVLGKILYGVLFVFTVLILLVVVIQRLSNNNLTFGGYRMFNIISESMVPEYNIGDILLAKEVLPEELKVGDNVTYLGKEGNFEGRIVTHQIISINNQNNNYIIQTKGIANDAPDPTINFDQVYGKVIYKFVLLSFIGKIATNLYGFYILVFIPLALLMAIKIREILQSLDDEENEKERKEIIENLKKEKKVQKNGK